MPHQASANDSLVISDDLFDLSLPEIQDGEGPVPQPEPSFALQMRHARFLLVSGGRNQYADRLEAMNPEPFTLD